MYRFVGFCTSSRTHGPRSCQLATASGRTTIQDAALPIVIRAAFARRCMRSYKKEIALLEKTSGASRTNPAIKSLSKKVLKYFSATITAVLQLQGTHASFFTFRMLAPKSNVLVQPSPLVGLNQCLRKPKHRGPKSPARTFLQIALRIFAPKPARITGTESYLPKLQSGGAALHRIMPGPSHIFKPRIQHKYQSLILNRQIYHLHPSMREKACISSGP